MTFDKNGYPIISEKEVERYETKIAMLQGLYAENAKQAREIERLKDYINQCSDSIAADRGKDCRFLKGLTDALTKTEVKG